MAEAVRKGLGPGGWRDDLPVVVAGMGGWPGLVPAISRDLGEALENSWRGVQNGIELVVLYRRPVHDAPRIFLAESRRVGGGKGSETRNLNVGISTLACLDTWLGGDDASEEIRALAAVRQACAVLGRVLCWVVCGRG